MTAISSRRPPHPPGIPANHGPGWEDQDSGLSWLLPCQQSAGPTRDRVLVSRTGRGRRAPVRQSGGGSRARMPSVLLPSRPRPGVRPVVAGVSMGRFSRSHPCEPLPWVRGRLPSRTCLPPSRPAGPRRFPPLRSRSRSNVTPLNKRVPSQHNTSGIENPSVRIRSYRPGTGPWSRLNPPALRFPTPAEPVGAPLVSDLWVPIYSCYCRDSPQLSEGPPQW